MTQFTDEKFFLETFNRLKDSIPKKEWQYYHIESLENFIYHLNSFSNDRTRNRVMESLINYMNVITEISRKEDVDYINIYRDLNRKYIYPLGNIYSDELGFVLKPDVHILLLALIVLFIIMYFLLSLALAVVIIIVLAGFIFFYYSQKLKQKKFYL